jgi:tetratricopeptide (TPR) repeat protein
MGRVYRARDTRLGRDVALKLMSETVASDTAAAQRFLREALAASALNHPNIITVHEFFDSDFGPILVMEVIEGKTLRELIAERPPVPVILDWCRQMARALQAAHASGIVHRDLKPDNVMVRHDGYVKILDFGIARLTRPSLADADGDATGTVTGTRPGVLLGTVRYMSPEQVRGVAVGAPSDVFSLGLVWYELLSGRHAFATESPIAMLHAIDSAQPLAPSALNAEIPQEIDGLLMRMLQKEPELRPSAGEIEGEILQLSRGPQAAAPAQNRTNATLQPTVGRENELTLLQQAFERSTRNGGHLICIAGEAGIGKSTLVELFLERVQESTSRVLIGRGRCSERLAGTEAYLPFLESLDSLLHRHPDLTRRLLRQHAPMWHLQVGSTTQDLPVADSSGSELRYASQERLKFEINAFLRELSVTAPVVLVFDDLHWADPSTIDLLNHLAHHFEPMRVLVVATYRSSDMMIAKHPFVAVRLGLQSKGLCTEIRLGFLSPDEVDRYVSLALPDHSLPPTFSAMLHARTEGNPLFVADLLRYLQDRGVILRTPSGWLLDGSFEQLAGELPASVRSMVERKIDQLTEEDRKILAAASVQGYEFDSAVVAEALQMDPADLEDRLSVLDEVHSFVRVVNEDELPDRTLSVRYRFVHALYQNAFYSSIRPTRRAALSGAVALSLESHLHTKRDGKAAELAILFETARRLEDAARYFLTAAANAAAIFAAGEAAALAKRGLEAVKTLPDSEKRLDLNLKLEVALAFALRIVKGNAAPETGGSMLRARELSERAGNHDYVPALLWGLWLYYQVGGDLATARHYGEQLLALGNQTGDRDVLLGAHTALGITAVHTGNLVFGHDHLQQAVTFHDPARHAQYIARYNSDPGAYAGPGTQRTLWLLGYSDQARQRTLQTLEWCRQFPDPQSVAFVHVFAAFYYQFCGDAVEAGRTADVCIAICEQHGIVQEREWVAPVRGWALARQGRVDEGISTLRDSLARHRAMQSQLNVPYYLALLAQVLLENQRIEEGLDAVEQGLQVARETHQTSFLAELYRLNGELFLASGCETDAAVQLLQRGLDVATEQCARSLQLRAAVSLVKASRGTRGEREARAMLQQVFNSFTEGFSEPDLIEAKALLT